MEQSWEHLHIEEERRVHDVIVIGAGVSGLVAAHRLKQAGVSDVLVLEAKDRVGGRTFGTTIEGRGGAVKIDLGGQWIGSTQPHALRLLDELGIKLYKQYDTGKNIIQMSDGRARLYTGTIPSCLTLTQLLNVGLLQFLVDSLVARVDVVRPSRTPNAAALDDETLASYVRRTSVSSALYEILTMVSRVVWGCDLSQISVLYALRYFKSAGTFMQVCESSEGGGQEFRVQGGAAQIAQKLHELVGRDAVLLLHPVAEIDQSGEGVRVTCTNGRAFNAKYVIMAIPPHLAGRVLYNPPMPAPRDQYTQRTPVGHLIKFVVTYNNAFWRTNGWSGQAISNFGPVCMVADATTHPDGQAALVGFIGGSQATLWSPRSAEERRGAVVAALVTMFGVDASFIIDYVEKDWGKEEWNGGCPVSLMSPGTLSLFEDVIRAPIGRLHFAGTETADVWCGFINGAIEAGERACGEVKERLGAKEGDHAPTSALLPPAPRYIPKPSMNIDVLMCLGIATVGLVAARFAVRHFSS